MQHRLEQFLLAENITRAQFADRIKVARAGISHIIAGRNKPGYEFIINTMEAFPELNIEWLLSGRGTMYKDGDSPSVPQENTGGADADLNVGLFAGDRVDDASETVGEAVSKASRCREISRIVVFYDDGTFRDFH